MRRGEQRAGRALAFRIEEDEAGRRLERVVARRFAVPVGLASKWLRTGRVRLEGARVQPGARAAAGQQVQARGIVPGRRAAAARARALAPLPAARQHELQERIVYRDADLLVLDKAAGEPVHAGSGHGRGLVEELQALLLAEGERPRPGFRLAAAHRLDRGTSGLVVFCLSGLALRGVHAQLRARSVQKRYRALVAGVPRPRAGVIELALGRAPGGGAVAVRPAGTQGARQAVTRYATGRVVRGGGLRVAELRLEPATGRRHQLRVHLAALGCPILGDRRYGEPEANRRFAELSGLERLWLHAAELELRHPRSGARLVLRSPVPAEFELALERLRGRREG